MIESLDSMMASAWLDTDRQLSPGAEIFRVDRRFLLWQFTASHGQMLLRSPKETDGLGRTHDTRIDVLFKPTAVMKVREVYDGLVIRVATLDEAAAVRAESPSIDALVGRFRVLLLETGGETDYVAATAVGWHEDRLTGTAPSHFAGHDTFPSDVNPLFGVDAGLADNIATAQQLIDALVTTNASALDRERYRYVFVVQTRLEPRSGSDSATVACAGVFLTRSEAETACDRMAAHLKCWIEDVPIGI